MDRREFMAGSLAGMSVAWAQGSARGAEEQNKDAFSAPDNSDHLPELPADKSLNSVPRDWLVTSFTQKTGVYRTAHRDEIAMTNGLVRRAWRLRPNVATVAFDNLMTGASLLRAVRPEAHIEVNWQRLDVGGLKGQSDYAYLTPEWVDRMAADPGAMQCTGYRIGKTQAPFAWKRTHFSNQQAWPPSGASLTFRCQSKGDTLPGITVYVHYEMYDGIPLLAKWLSIQNETGSRVRLNRFTNEILAAVEYESAVSSGRWVYPNIHVESDYEFGGGMTSGTCNQTAHWGPDPDYTTQVNYKLETPCLLKVHPPLGPDVDILPGKTFESYRTYELVFDSTDRERKGLAQRRMYRTIAPWAMENPIFMHITSIKPEVVKSAIDQAADVGFEMAILSFGSGFDPENQDPKFIAEMKSLNDYANAKGIVLGGYSLLASRNISPGDDVINPKTGTTEGAIFGYSPCLGSKWGIAYFKKLRSFFEMTGMGVLENDGSYPGDVCASTHHLGHRGLEDSQWTQWTEITTFYRWCRARGIYLNVPDWYFLNGSNKDGMGYRETDWSLPRAQQVIIGRQNIYDGTWIKTPSMGWMFVPLVQYHGGGAAATIEPLREHLETYGQILAQNMGSGAQAAYRGYQLYDSEQTRDVVKKWVAFYKAHRAILESDIIHVRRADGRDLDAILHVNPALGEKGFAMVYNPLDVQVTRTITLPLYYTGLTQTARIREQEGKAREYHLNRKAEVEVALSVPARGLTWLVIE